MDLSPHQPSMPKELSLLPQLQSIQLGHNSIYASLTEMIPIRLYRSDAFVHLDLCQNSIYGTIPQELTWFSNLQTLRLQWNQVAGSIPTGMGKLTALQELDLSYNSLTGSIPSELGLLTALTSLDLSNNFWSDATIPEELLALQPNLKIVI